MGGGVPEPRRGEELVSGAPGQALGCGGLVGMT